MTKEAYVRNTMKYETHSFKVRMSEFAKKKMSELVICSDSQNVYTTMNVKYIHNAKLII